MFALFERLTDPFAPDSTSPPPRGLLRFAWTYARPFRSQLLATAIVSALIAVVEVALFGFLGSLVDWLGAADRETLWQDHGTALLWMALLVLVAYPGLHTLSELIVHQGLLGNFAMNIRWRAHRTLLRQSLGFFQDEFAGRVATKVMQTALAVRDTVVQLV
jgi:ATP-binding cassette, subfamily B, multidrug efflux pump